MNNVFNASLFYGTAGIGYEMLRLISPDTIECVFL
jgi:lantibiotic modifying enzyme